MKFFILSDVVNSPIYQITLKLNNFDNQAKGRRIVCLVIIVLKEAINFLAQKGKEITLKDVEELRLSDIFLKGSLKSQEIVAFSKSIGYELNFDNSIFNLLVLTTSFIGQELYLLALNKI